MATQEIGVEQPDGRWNESSGDYIAQGISTQVLHPANYDHNRSRSFVEFLFHFFFFADSFFRCRSRESFRL